MTTWYRRDASFNPTGRALAAPPKLHLPVATDRARARCAPHGTRRIILLTDDERDGVDDPEQWRCCQRCWVMRQNELEAVALDYEEAQLVISLLSGMDDSEDHVRRQARSLERRMREIWPPRKLD